MPETQTQTLQPKPADTVTLTIDGQTVTARKGMTVLEACKEHGIEVPTFCWHPKLRSVGSCRICYVEIEKMPKLMVSCSTEVMEGMVVRTNSEKVREGRKAVIEFTLLDHPLDCPTCDKGGECDLQDHAFDYGLTDDTRYEFNKFRFVRDKKSTFDDLQIGPEMVRNQNRCILCYKCTRANEEAFGEHDIGVYYRGNIAEINSPPGGQVESLYSGNLVEICPVGALTASDWRYKIRVWNTNTVPSVCPYHSDGANTDLWKDRANTKVFRATSRRNDDVDEGWLSDITRYGYQIANSERRLTTPLVKKNGKLTETSWEEALDVIADRLKEIKSASGAPSLAGVISPQLDLASLHAFNKFMRGALGSNNVDYRSTYNSLPTEPGTTYGYLSNRSFKISQIADSDVIFVVGSDLIREHPNVHLWTRKAVTKRNARLYTANPLVTKSGDCSTDEMIYTPGTDEAFLNGVTLSLIKQNFVASGADISQVKTLLAPNTIEECAKISGVSVDRINACAKKLGESKNPCIIGGELISTSTERLKIANALFNIATLLGIVSGERGQAAILAKSCNSKGAEALGLYPELSQDDLFRLNRIFGESSELSGANWDAMLKGAHSEDIKAMIIMGANPVQLGPDRNYINKALESLDFLVVADLFETPTSALADVVLPLCSYTEFDGTFVNLEGREQKFTAGMKKRGSSRTGYEALNSLAEKFGYKLYSSASALEEEVASAIESYRAAERKPQLQESQYKPSNGQSAGAYPLIIGDALHHFGHWTEYCESLKSFDPEAALEVSMETAEKLGVESGDSVRVVNGDSKVTLKIKVSKILEGSVVYAPVNFAMAAVNSLVNRNSRVNYVTIEKIAK